MGTLEVLNECVSALGFRQRMCNLAVNIRHISENDVDTLKRAVHTVSVMARVLEEVRRRSFDDPLFHTMSVYILLDWILDHPKEAKQALKDIEQEEMARRREVRNSDG
jgi:hypothetical protein